MFFKIHFAILLPSFPPKNVAIISNKKKKGKFKCAHSKIYDFDAICWPLSQNRYFHSIRLILILKKTYLEYFLSLFLRRFFLREEAMFELSAASEAVLASSASEAHKDFEADLDGSM